MDKLPVHFQIARGLFGHLRMSDRVKIHTSNYLRKDEKDDDSGESDSKETGPQKPTGSSPFSTGSRKTVSPERRLKEMLNEYRMSPEYLRIMDEIFRTSQHTNSPPPKQENKATSDAHESEGDDWDLGLENVKFPEDEKLFVPPFLDTQNRNLDGKDAFPFKDKPVDSKSKLAEEKLREHRRRKMSPLQRVHELIPKEYWQKIEDKDLKNVIDEMNKVDPKLPDDKD